MPGALVQPQGKRTAMLDYHCTDQLHNAEETESTLQDSMEFWIKENQNIPLTGAFS